MKVILYMAITVNGLIAKEDDDTSWVTETEWKSFKGIIKKHGNMIIGRRTYEVMLKNDEFNISSLNTIRTIVLTSDETIRIHNRESVSIAKSPQEALHVLSNASFETIMVCGGGGLNSSFMKENLVDEIYIDIEPMIFGQGIKLFADANFEKGLELVGTKKLSPNEIQLCYKVKR
ncbi:dihydrofolate reductase [Candidatus Daviesbacteria bacterium]|nr:dihydrofolate reductase [Candidatus Daviesbacteria bacterium]